MTIKAIETRYNGYPFRSRLEARWAVFFDYLSIEYDYEPEGYKLGKDIFYLPDFWLPNQKLWIEIKGPEPSNEEQQKACELALASGHRASIFTGKIKVPQSTNDLWGATDATMFFPDGGIDCGYIWCKCPTCDKLDVQFCGRGSRICYHPGNHDRDCTGAIQKLINAYRAARSARFEHGETP